MILKSWCTVRFWSTFIIVLGIHSTKCVPNRTVNDRFDPGPASTATTTEILKNVANLLRNIGKPITPISNKLVKQDEDNEDSAYSQITNSFGGVLAEGLIGNILAPQTGDVRDFLGELTRNFIRFTSNSPVTTTTTTTTTTSAPRPRRRPSRRQPVIHSGPPPESSQPSYGGALVVNTNPGVLGGDLGGVVGGSGQVHRAPTPTKATAPDISFPLIAAGVLGSTVLRAPESPTFLGGGTGGAVGALVRGVVSGVVNAAGLGPTTTTLSPQQIYLQHIAQVQLAQAQAAAQKPIIYILPSLGVANNEGNLEEASTVANSVAVKNNEEESEEEDI